MLMCAKMPARYFRDAIAVHCTIFTPVKNPRPDNWAMVCKGICTQYKTTARYEENHKRCRMCDIFIHWEGARCPCCSFALRTRARNARKAARID